MKLLLVYLLIINAIGFAVMLADKYNAKKNLWRIPEATLMGIAVIGGSIGVYAGLRLFRHKTLHPKFSVGVPIILAIQVLLCVLIIR